MVVLSKCLNDVMSACPWCGQVTRYTHVAGHVQCDACKRVVQDCCNGERADNGLFGDDDVATLAHEETQLRLIRNTA